MSLWTPYADAPLDLSKVKEECRTPPEETHSPVDYYGYRPYPTPPGIAHPVPYYPTYAYYPSVSSISPVSASSSCSGCEAAPPVYGPALSPPKTPPHKNYMAEADVLSDDPDFQAFERDALQAMAEKNGGTLLGNNPRMRRAVQTSQPLDDSYRRQRERNNFAAKQSRDRRKLREIHLALKVAYLKNEVSKLKVILAGTTCVRCNSER